MIFCNWGIYPAQTDGHEKVHSAIVSDGCSDYKQSLTTNTIGAFAFSVPPVQICVWRTVLLVITCLFSLRGLGICFVGFFK